jgi:hypothetical protein
VLVDLFTANTWLIPIPNKETRTIASALWGEFSNFGWPKYANFARNKNHEFVPLVAESLGGLGGMAIKLFGEIARAQASSRHPVGHILRRLIDISQIAVQKGNFRRFQKAVALCSTDDPFSNSRVSRDHLWSMV